MTDKLDGIHESEDLHEEEEADWLDDLRTNAPSLVVDSNFTPRCSAQSANLNKEDFARTLTEFILRCEGSAVSIDPVVIETLYQHALSDHKQMAAWDAACRMVESDEFKKSVAYIEQEVARHAKVRKLLLERGSEEPPRWTSEWREAWFGASVQLTGDILAHLLGALRDLRSMSHITKLGRTSIESHLIALAKVSIRTEIANSSCRVPLKTVVAAYAHASRLLFFRSSEDADYVTTVNMRVSRARRSKEAAYVLSTLLVHLM